MSITRRLFAICIGLALLSLVVVGLEIRTTAASASNRVVPLFVLPATSLKTGNREPTTRRSWHRSIPQSPQTEKTIGEVRKNIQVLKEFPDSQLIPMMNLMSASLGVKCDFCHVVKDGHLEPPLDDKPEKKQAREMITMTLSINKTSFNGRNEVSCFTCHRGRNQPVAVVALPLPEPAPRPGRGGPGSAGPVAPVPTVDDILNKYVAALGGQAAIDKLKTRVMKGTYAAANGMTATFQVDQSAPDKFHITFSTPQATMERGFNGSAGWEKNPRGVTDMAGNQLADMKHSFALFGDIKLKEQFTRMNVRKDKLDGRDVYLIVAATADGQRERLFFDAETGLLLRRTTAVQTPVGVVPQETSYEDYRDIDGVKIPFTIRVSTTDPGSTATRKYSEIKVNVPVDDASFNKPAAAPRAVAQPKP
jgi:hypothetical protein